MKKIVGIATVIVGLVCTAHSSTYAQAEAAEPMESLRVGGAIVLSTGIFEESSLNNYLGLQLNGVYRINEEWSAAADFIFYLPQSEGDIDTSVWELNFNGHYILYEEDKLTGYGLGGINITSYEIEENSESEFGLNLGGGFEYVLEFADLFGEAKFGGIGGDADQFVFAAGLRFEI